MTDLAHLRDTHPTLDARIAEQQGWQIGIGDRRPFDLPASRKDIGIVGRYLVDGEITVTRLAHPLAAARAAPGQA